MGSNGQCSQDKARPLCSALNPLPDHFLRPKELKHWSTPGPSPGQEIIACNLIRSTWPGLQAEHPHTQKPRTFWPGSEHQCRSESACRGRRGGGGLQSAPADSALISLSSTRGSSLLPGCPPVAVLHPEHHSSHVHQNHLNTETLTSGRSPGKQGCSRKTNAGPEEGRGSRFLPDSISKTLVYWGEGEPTAPPHTLLCPLSSKKLRRGGGSLPCPELYQRLDQRSQLHVQTSGRKPVAQMEHLS